MRSWSRHVIVAALAATTIATASIMTPTDASARPFGFHGGWHGGFHRGWHGPRFGPAFAGAFAFGALAAAPYYYGGYPYYYDDCVPRRVVGYTPWGRPIVRIVRACY
jgi:hypothetical protein